MYSSHSLTRGKYDVKTMDQIDLYDLATAFIAFGMVLGLAVN